MQGIRARQRAQSDEQRWCGEHAADRNAAASFAIADFTNAFALRGVDERRFEYFVHLRAAELHSEGSNAAWNERDR